MLLFHCAAPAALCGHAINIRARAGPPPTILGFTAGADICARIALGLVYHGRKITKKSLLFIAT